MVVVSRRVADDVSAMGCVFGLEELAHPLWDENGCLVQCWGNSEIFRDTWDRSGVKTGSR